MNAVEMKRRTYEFAKLVVEFYQSLGAGQVARVLADQFLRSGTSVGANYRAACRAKSTADFISKMGTVEEECDECLFWLDLISETNKTDAETGKLIRDEGNQILKMVVASIRTAKSKR